SLCFLFTSSRRHTSFSRDWRSDVCSSDLTPPQPSGNDLKAPLRRRPRAPGEDPPTRPAVSNGRKSTRDRKTSDANHGHRPLLPVEGAKKGVPCNGPPQRRCTPALLPKRGDNRHKRGFGIGGANFAAPQRDSR